MYKNKIQFSTFLSPFKSNIGSKYKTKFSRNIQSNSKLNFLGSALYIAASDDEEYLICQMMSKREQATYH
jgi:hypothetical protein